MNSVLVQGRTFFSVRMRSVAVRLRRHRFSLPNAAAFSSTAAAMTSAESPAAATNTQVPVATPVEGTHKKVALTTPTPAVLRVQKLSDKAKIPTRGSPLAAGYDLYSAEDVVIPAQGKAIVKTDISIAVPLGTYGRVAPRSGLAVKHHLDVGAGVVDADYRGPLGVVLFNLGKQDFQVSQGDRIAQLVLEQILNPDVVEVASLEDTERGQGGFGSTGKN